MSTPTPRKPLSGTINATTKTRQPENSPNRTSTAIPSTTGQGLARTTSMRSGRPIRKTPTRTSVSADADVEDDDDTKAANAQLIADLREQVERAEQASEQYRKQLENMQKRLDEAADEQTAGEERDFAARTQIDQLQAEVKDGMRQQREMELSYDSERTLLLQERERQAAREAELQSVVNRLTESIKMKSLERASTQRSATWTDHDEHPAADPSGTGEDYAQIMQDKDNAIESLRLELADAHIKLTEQEHMGDGRQQMLEKELQQVKMQNARLLEENDSFQMLLGEKTLKGDFLHDPQADSQAMTSLAEELESAGEETEISTDAYRKLEADLKAIREEKKALTLYIDKIIGRLLQHEGFEHIITGKDDVERDETPEVPARPMVLNKALPAPPPPAAPVAGSPPAPSAIPAYPMSFLQRARSVVARPTGPKPRPQSYMPPAPSANENPATAPSIPINRGHRRARSDQTQTDLGAAAALVQQMNRGSPLRTASGGPMSPGISPLNRAQTSYFVPSTTTASGRAPSQSGTAGQGSSANSIVSEHSLERESTDASSAQTSAHGRESGAIPGAVMKQNQLRPLRLVQEQTLADEEAQKRANRGSWMGWFKAGSVEAQNEQ